jgi:gas vesicle protein
MYLLVALFIAVGAVCGYAAGRLFAPLNDVVRLETILREQPRAAENELPEIEAFQRLGRSSSSLFAEAESIKRRLAVGGILIGVWIGAIAGFKLAGLTRVPREDKYTIDRAWCVSCCRCFKSCPKERVHDNHTDKNG